MYFWLTVIVLSTTYLVAMIFLLIGWRKALKSTTSSDPSFHSISVIIPVRDERSNILNLLQQLENSTYPSLDVVVIDDHSTDGTYELVQQWVSGRTKFRCMKSSGQGKKAALTFGISSSKHTLIVTTDGDCRVDEQWLFKINDCFKRESVKLVFGGVAIQDDGSLFGAMQGIEFVSLIGGGAALWAQGYPVMCNGANLAFRRNVFEAVKGYEGNLHIASGDDEFLMRKITNAFPGSVAFLNVEDAVVYTASKTSVADFFRQRFRWAGKWKYNDAVSARLVAVFVLLVQINFLVMIGVLLYPVANEMKIMALTILLVRAIADAVFLKRVAWFLRVRWRWDAFILLQLFYPIYVVVTGLFSNFMAVTWKNRRIL